MIRKSNTTALGRVMIESYNGTNELLADLQTRTRKSNYVDDEYKDAAWVGVKNRGEAMEYLKSGYQPTVEALSQKIRANIKTSGEVKRMRTFASLVGYAPIVPAAIIGLPNSMLNCQITAIKTKVIDVYYDMTASCGVDCKKIIEAGQKMLGAIMALERQGYRFNLYAMQSYSDRESCDMLTVKIKNADRQVDLKRMSFPATHTAFFRGVGFEWYAKCPESTYRTGYGRALVYGREKDEIKKAIRELFGKGAVYFSCAEIIKISEASIEDSLKSMGESNEKQIV